MQAERQSSLPGFEGLVPGEKRDRVQKNLGLTSEGVMSKMNFLSRNRGRVIACITWFVAGLVGTSPTTGRADEIGPADPVLPLPLYHNKPDNFGLFDGGLFFATSFAAYKQTNPISHQGVAYRGFTDVTGTARVPYVYNPVTNETENAPVAPFVGRFYGSGEEALNTDQVSGPGTMNPGIKISAGWRFGDRVTVTASWMWLADATYTSSASNIPAGSQIGANYADSFLSAPVYNFYPEYAGPNDDLYNSNGASTPNTIANGIDAARGAGYGIWNAAEVFTQSFTQRAQFADLLCRVPVYENENYRVSGVVGPKFVWLWEKYMMRAVDYNIYGESNGESQAVYTNIVSNRMYGAVLACQQEWYMGHGFALNLNLGGGMYMDIVKARARYELGQKFLGPVSKRSRTLYELAPSLEGTVGVGWYPFEGIELNIGYNLMGFFNTISSRHPIDFDFGTVDPAFDSQTRWFSGFQAGFALVF